MGRVDSNAPEAPGWQKLRPKAYLRVADLPRNSAFRQPSSFELHFLSVFTSPPHLYLEAGSKSQTTWSNNAYGNSEGA